MDAPWRTAVDGEFEGGDAAADVGRGDEQVADAGDRQRFGQRAFQPFDRRRLVVFDRDRRAEQLEDRGRAFFRRRRFDAGEHVLHEIFAALAVAGGDRQGRPQT